MWKAGKGRGQGQFTGDGLRQPGAEVPLVEIGTLNGFYSPHL